MKTNYKQSQAAPHAKPIFTVSRNDSTLYVPVSYTHLDVYKRQSVY